MKNILAGFSTEPWIDTDSRGEVSSHGKEGDVDGRLKNERRSLRLIGSTKQRKNLIAARELPCAKFRELSLGRKDT